MALEAALHGPSETETRLGSRIVDLRDLTALDLDPLLGEQIEEWARELDWDHSKSAELVRKLIDARELGGIALINRDHVIGYGYCGLAGHKACISDVYVNPAWRGGNAEAVQFRSLFEAPVETPGVRRLESQLILTEPQSVKMLERQHGLRIFERLLMKLDLASPLAPGKAAGAGRFHLQPWEDRYHEAAATALWLSHIRHVDAEISEQYRSFAGACRFVQDLVRFPGSAAFCAPASYVAFDKTTRQVAGISLASVVANGVAHLAELCVLPQSRGAGLGYELLCQTTAALRNAGAKRISLTVTTANSGALRLYTNSGFRELRRFAAYVWNRA